MTSTRERYGWLDRADCRDYPDWDERHDWTVLVEICRRCPVRYPCLLSAVELNTDGVRGGTTPKQRGRRRDSGGRRLSLELSQWIHMVDGRTHNPHDDQGMSNQEAYRRLFGHQDSDMPTPNPMPKDRRAVGS